MSKRKAYKVTSHMATSPVLAHMRRTAYAPVSLNEDVSESVEMQILQKAMDKRQRKMERNIKNANE